MNPKEVMFKLSCSHVSYRVELRYVRIKPDLSCSNIDPLGVADVSPSMRITYSLFPLLSVLPRYLRLDFSCCLFFDLLFCFHEGMILYLHHHRRLHLAIGHLEIL